MDPQDDIPFSSYMELLGGGNGDNQPGSGSQSSSQGFVAGLANDKELFGDIKGDEDLKAIFENSQPTSLQIPLSPGSTVSVESMETIVDLMDGRLTTDRPVTPKNVYTSLVKQEVKYKVKLNQLNKGIDPDEVCQKYNEKKEPVEKSPESLRRIEERKRKNRVAAQKCRIKKRRSEELLKETVKKLTLDNEERRKDIQKFREQFSAILSAYETHYCVMTPQRPDSPDLGNR